MFGTQEGITILAKHVRNIEDTFYDLLLTAPGTKENKQGFFFTQMKVYIAKSNYETMWRRLVEELGRVPAAEAVFDYVLHTARPRLRELLDLTIQGEDFQLRRQEPAVARVLFFESGGLRRVGEHLLEYMKDIRWSLREGDESETSSVSKARGFRYDVALSLAGEDRPYVRQVAKKLRELGVDVFYDEFKETEMWGKDLPAYLDEIFRKSARFCVMFLSKHYARKAYPRFEGRAALARAVRGREDYLLPVRFDETPFPGLPATLKYLDAGRYTPVELAQTIFKRLGA